MRNVRDDAIRPVTNNLLRSKSSGRFVLVSLLLLR